MKDEKFKSYSSIDFLKLLLRDVTLMPDTCVMAPECNRGILFIRDKRTKKHV